MEILTTPKQQQSDDNGIQQLIDLLVQKDKDIQSTLKTGKGSLTLHRDVCIDALEMMIAILLQPRNKEIYKRNMSLLKQRLRAVIKISAICRKA